MSSVDSQPLPPGHRFGGGRSPCALHEHAGWAHGIPGRILWEETVGFGIPTRWDQL